MTKPKRAFDTEYGRFYAHPASGVPSNIMRSAPFDPSAPTSPKPSVTNIIALMDEGFLPGYYAKLVSEYAVANFSQLKYAAERFGPDVAIGQLKAVPNRPNPEGLIGDEVHDAIDRYHQGEQIEDFETVTAKHMFERYLEFFGKHRPKVVRTEFTVWSYKHGYAGSGDLMWRLGDRLWIVDSKTGTRVYPKVAMQNAALANADVIIEEDGTEKVMPSIDNLGVLHIRPRSCRLYELQHTDAAFAAFLALKTAFDWIRFEKQDTIPLMPVLQVPEGVISEAD
jgi:hypothetical protein